MTATVHSGSCRDPAANRRTNHSLLLGCHEIKSLHFLNSHVPFIFLRSVRIQIEASWFAGCGTWLVTMVLIYGSFRNSPENHQKVTRISYKHHQYFRRLNIPPSFAASFVRSWRSSRMSGAKDGRYDKQTSMVLKHSCRAQWKTLCWSWTNHTNMI